MLILSRKQEESIVIRDDIVITILAIEGDKVKIGIQAPRDVQVYRQELWLAIQEQNRIVESLTQAAAPAGFESLRAYLAEEISNSGNGELAGAAAVEPAADAVNVSQHLSDDGV